MRKTLIALACGLLITCKIYAATPLEPIAFAPGSESDFFSELPVVLSVSRLSQNQHDVPGAVTVIDREMIRQSGARDLAELLRFVPGFQVAVSSSGVPVANYHGMTSDVPRGMQLLVDGRSLYSAVTAGVPWDLIDFSLADIERVEVLRGSNSATYGSNAFMGVVNVITRDLSQTHGIEVYAAKGDQNVNDRYIRLGGGAGGVQLSADR